MLFIGYTMQEQKNHSLFEIIKNGKKVFFQKAVVAGSFKYLHVVLH